MAHAALTHACPVCGGAATLLDAVDFNKSCEDLRGRVFTASGVRVEYVLCDGCGFSFAPEIARWTRDEFAARIYNDDYHLVDPDYREVRPLGNARFLSEQFGRHALELRHLDYGGGNGELSAALFGAGWDSQSYDPFVDGELPPDLGKFNLVTCFEVFEHVPDVNALIKALGSLVDDRGVVLFSTLISDGQVARGKPLQWSFAAPRNGHISLFSSRSLSVLGAKEGFTLASANPALHMYWRELPDWAAPFVAPTSKS